MLCAVPQVLVGEPSVPDTVQILRGLKERYSSHHGVQVSCCWHISAKCSIGLFVCS
jgi:hypothetical protein